MDTQGGGRKRAATKTSAEDQALDQIAKEAEARLAARRQARAEARDIRMREVERQQKEAEHGGPAILEPVVRTTPRSRATNHSSRRSSEDSLEDGGSLRDTRMELKELEEKFRKAMIQNAQLDNEKASLGYQLGLLKDQSEDLLEAHTQLGREHRDKCRAHDQLARANHRLGEELALANAAWAERDRLIAERGLAIAGDGDERCLVSVEAAETLAGAGQGSLDVRLSRLAEERADLADQLRRAQAELSERQRDPAQSGVASGSARGDTDEEEANREAARMLQEARFRLQKADQDVATLQATVARLESQVVRYKASAESSELAENELKVERRKLQRLLREAQVRVEELESSNLIYQKRFDKLKNAKSSLLKDL